MLDSDFKNVVTLRKPKVGSRTKAQAVDWERVLDDSNEPIRIPCFFKRSGNKVYELRESHDHADATMLFQATPDRDVTPEQIVIDERGDAYKYLTVDEVEDLELDTTYKQLRLKRIDLRFPEDVEDVR